ncbi:protein STRICTOSIDINE SYNTHASE-LIKE 12-like [Bidens hawaiensis]|uniref:protein STRICTOSIDINE SYNTHASE-LIKE 12-like n=1 Tax=Bidens hawaiensis TaxID=980011 RepID=UPI00404AB8EB
MATLKILTSSLLYVFVALLSTFVVVSGQFATFSKLELPQGVSGPESAAFRGFLLFTEGPFTSVYDGRIMKWQGPIVGFVDFAYTAPGRNKQFCDGTTDPYLGPTCGRPLALSFNPKTRLLYIVDAFFGLLVVGPTGGLATQLAGGFKFALGVDVDLITGNVYFSDGSLTYDIRNTTQPGFKPDSTGRLLCYDPVRKRVDVLLSGLSGGGGPAVSPDGTFVLVPEFNSNRISKYWLVGPKAGQVELLLNNVGNPNKIKRAGRFGEFWVALSIGFVPPTPLITPQGVRFNSNGVVLQTVSFATQFFNKSITLVQEQNGKLYVGSRLTNFIGVYSN